MKHANNIREKICRADNAGLTAKKAAEEKRSSSRLEHKNDRIEIGKGTVNAGVGVRAMGNMPYLESSKHTEEEVAIPKKTGADEKKTWIKGSSESKKIGSRHCVKGKL